MILPTICSYAALTDDGETVILHCLCGHDDAYNTSYVETWDSAQLARRLRECLRCQLRRIAGTRGLEVRRVRQ